MGVVVIYLEGGEGGYSYLPAKTADVLDDP